MAVNGNQKGKRGEREASQALSEIGIFTRRSQQYCGKDGDSDLVGNATVELPLHLEVKRVEALQLYTSVEQAVSDSAASGKLPVVLHKKNHKPWLIVLRLEDLPELVQSMYTYYHTPKEIVEEEFKPAFTTQRYANRSAPKRVDP